jgi:TonB-dependent receptor
MHYPKANKKLISLAVAGACAAFGASAYAQDAASASSDTTAQAAGVQTVVVSGIRQSMASSLNLKRNSDGIVDGIVAEDIGKFPDTNLAESLQRISGVSIDRTNGEGQKVTVRGIGPDFNMVLLNGRQMPTSNLGDLNGRAFDFSNLASEAISQLQVYKTSRAETPAGGIGATINVLTARPLDRLGTYSSIGIKAVHDRSNENLPGDVKASNSTTPEFSGIYTTTSKDGRWGVGVSASYQERNSGYNQAAVSSGWKGPFRGDDTSSWGTIPQTGATNRPTGSTVYEVPQNLNYSFTGVKRQRTNGQLTLQFAPSKEFVNTLDYTYSQNKLQTKRNDLSAWFNFGPSTSSWTNGPVAAPLVYTEQLAGTSDIAMGGGNFATKTDNKSLGFNSQWRPTSDLKLEFDAHHSTAESMADSPYGSFNTLGTASFSRGNTTADFSKDFPVLSITGADFVKAPQQVTGSNFQNGYMLGKIDQYQAKGRLRMLESSNLNFGLGVIKVSNRSAISNNQRDDTWGGATKPSDYPSSLWHPATVRGYFNKIDGSGNPSLFNNFYTFNFNEVRDVAAKVTGKPELYTIKKTFDTDQRTKEDSKNLYLQFNTDWDTRFPMHTAIGVRYEKTDVVSTALVPAATAYAWKSQNEFEVVKGAPTFTTLTGKYHNLLPSIDWDMDLRSDMKVRASYGETIGRPRYDQIAGGQILENQGRVDGGTGRQGNPALKPVKSKNFDLSFEWYYAKQSFASVNAFYKDLDNYAGQSQVIETPFNLHTPVGGALWNEALKSCANSDTTCIRNYIFRNHPTAPGVVFKGNDSIGNATGDIIGQPNDPITNFRITSYSNQKKASLNGLEFNVQHMFNNGFGVSANYTYVHSGLRYDNASVGEQFALVGLSNSYNVVGIYENDKWNARLAYNWRGEFLASTFDGAGPNPVYTEPYGQLDLSVGYNITEKLSLQVEAINLTNQTTRSHGRAKQMVEYATQTGARYMVGARYKF